MIILILIIIFIASNYYFSKKEHLLTTKKVITDEQRETMRNIILKKMCEKKGYGYDKHFQNCIHIKKSTCLKEHPGYMVNEADIKLFNEYKDSPCTQQLESLMPIKAEVGEWLEATQQDKELYEKTLNEYNQQRKITEKHKTKENITKLFELNVRLMRSDRNKDSKCQYSDQNFKYWCIRNKLKYVPDKSGIGKCIVTPGYCASKIMDYDKTTKNCKKKDKVAELLFGATITRTFQSIDGNSKNKNCENAPCFKDEYCAGRGICRPISNPGHSCWNGEDESCWCNSKCKMPFTWEVVETVAAAVGAVVLAVASVAIVVATLGTAVVLMGMLAGVLLGMGAGASAVRSTQVSADATRCSAGKDGINIPGGKNGTSHFMKLGNSGCYSDYPCPDNHYCPIGNGPCKKAKQPGETCMGCAPLSWCHNWCAGDSKCITGTRGSKCSAGKDGINPPGPIYKTVKTVKKNTLPINPILKRKLELLQNMDSFSKDTNFMARKSMINPPDQINMEETTIKIGDNGSSHYMKLGESGCGISTPCPPGYYCPVGNGPCKKAKDPGKYCLAGINSWCKGNSICFTSNSRCSAGKDGINPPGPLYYKDENGANIIEKGMIYHNGTDHYMAINSESIVGIHGCDPVVDYYKYPKGYFCKSAWHNLKPQKNPGDTCLAAANIQCMGNSKCILAARGYALCAAGSDGKKPAGDLYSWDQPTSHTTVKAHIWKGKNIQEIRFDSKYIKPNEIINKQQTTDNHIPLNISGCSIAATCPTHITEKNKITHTYCPVGNGKCKLPKEAGGVCPYVPGIFIGNNWCKEQRCKGSTCSTKLDNKWYVPIGGTCADIAGVLKTDKCEPDTHCNHPFLLKGTITNGTCKFGNG